MDCSQAKSLFNAFLDGELNGSLAAEFATHKLQCASCRRELALLEVMGHVLSTDTVVPELNADFTDRLMACALEPARPQRLWRRRVLYIGGPLAAAACVLLALSVFRGVPVKPETEITPQVLPFEERMDSPEAMLRQVEKARETHPESRELAALEDALRQRVAHIASGTEEGTKLLENFGKMTIMEILDSIQLDRPQEQQDAQPAANTSGVEHVPPADSL
ncbi:MAG TPA: zf-HC2 domain-containing protein [Phycisphaerae bacterium]|nr:zf-HC2 domain-containing protein [Phycisphaerales bacterium]HRX85487.1 zf-HC2 domain-containing protein [Phycisphaerae bacterium]